MRDVQRIAIVDPSDATREELRNVLLGMEGVWLEAESPRYEFFNDVIRQSCPDVVMVSIDSDPNKALVLIGQLAEQEPDLPILAISARGDGQAILKALRSGAREFLTSPVVLEELLQALQRMQRGGGGGNGTRVSGSSMDMGNGRPERMGSLVISILGSRGGVGCTSLAVNIGANLAMEPGCSVALVDLDLALGDAHVALDMTPDYTLADVAMNVDRLDMTFLRRSLSKHSSGLSLLPHPSNIEDISLIREDHLQRVIGLLRASYTHLVLDLSKSLSPCDLTALRASDIILLVGQLELSSLMNIVRIMMSLGNDEMLGRKVKIVLNQVTAETDISVKKAEEIIGKSIYWQVPADPRVLHESRTEGVPLVQKAPKSKVQQAIGSLSLALCGKEVSQRQEKKGVWNLFSQK
jgi:pilus assembly protein CpaE